MFEFDILCRTYGYTDDTHKLCLFPTTLKKVSLKWYMGLREHLITSWDEMKKKFLKNYQTHCKPKDSEGDFFRMSQQEDESLEEYLEQFLYNVQKSKQLSQDPNTIKTILLKAIRDEYLDILNVMGKTDMSYM